MASVYDLKPAFQRILAPLLRALRAAGVTPNALTLAAVAGSVVVAVFVAREAANPRALLLLPGWLFLRMALNALDGMMARQYAMATPAGAVLNELGDVLSDAALVGSLLFVDPRAVLPGFVFLFVAALTEFCGVLSQALGHGRRYDGPMGKSDRAFLVGAWALVAAFSPLVLGGLPWVLWAGSVLGVLTCVKRLKPALAGGDHAVR